MLDTYCGKDVPDPIVSSQSDMKLIFRSDKTSHESGFRIKWRYDRKFLKFLEIKIELRRLLAMEGQVR